MDFMHVVNILPGVKDLCLLLLLLFLIKVLINKMDVGDKTLRFWIL